MVAKTRGRSRRLRVETPAWVLGPLGVTLVFMRFISLLLCFPTPLECLAEDYPGYSSRTPASSQERPAPIKVGAGRSLTLREAFASRPSGPSPCLRRSL